MPERDPLGDPGTIVGLPESLDRRMRLGPFPTARHALKFAAYAAVGGSVAALLGAIWSVPFVGIGFVLSVYRSDGRGLDEQAGDLLAFCWRVRPGGARAGGAPAPPHASGPYLDDARGHLVAIEAVEGIPIAFLPPADARLLFESYRELLRVLARGLVVQMGVRPLAERSFVPGGRSADSGRADELARRGYAEMVTLLCRRRYRRRVLLAVWEPAGPGAAARLDREVARLEEGLARIGLLGTRLRDRSLRAAAVQMGWTGGARE